jgi:hypothetical protein
MALGLIALLIWSTMGELARNPSREAIADLGQYGLVTVQLQTDPYPARPTGTVGLSFMLMNSRNVSIEPDSFSFEYGRGETTNQLVQGLLSRCRMEAVCSWLGAITTVEPGGCWSTLPRMAIRMKCN